MPNGKGALACRYCIHFTDPNGSSAGFGCGGHCGFHGVDLPDTSKEHHNRICCHFEPNDAYHRDNPMPQFSPLVQRFAWFGIDMKPGVLYEFFYNDPPGIREAAVMREPDYHGGGWKEPRR